MAGSLLESLGLQAGRLPKVAGPDGRMIDLNLPPGYDPDKAAARAGAPAPGAGAGQPDPAAAKTAKTPADLKLPSDPAKQIDLIAEALKRIKDPVKQDPLVKALRDAISKIPQPFFTQQEFRKKLDDAIDAALDAGAKALLKAAIEAITGKKVEEPEEPGVPMMPGLPEPPKAPEAPGEFILKSPKIPLPWDNPKPRPAPAHFEFKSPPKAGKAGGYADFTVVTPQWWSPGKYPGTWLEALDADDYKKNGDGARSKKQGTHVVEAGTLKLSLPLPDDAGSYVVVVKVQGGVDGDAQPITLK